MAEREPSIWDLTFNAGSLPAPEPPPVQTVVDPWDVNPLRNNPDKEAEQAALRADETRKKSAQNAQREKDKSDLEFNTAKLAYDVAKQKFDEANSPEARAAAKLLLAKAEIDLATASIQLEKARNAISPQRLAEIENDLAIARDDFNNRFAAARDDRKMAFELEKMQAEIDSAWERQEAQNEFTGAQKEMDRALTREEGAKDRQKDIDLAEMSGAIALSGQEIQKATGLDKFTTDMIANQIRSGELSVDRAFKIAQLAIDQRRLPSEITRNIGQAIAPMVPHLSGYKSGQIPLGFESGGPFEVAMRQGGVTTYNPEQYAVQNTKVDLFGMAKGAGADFSQKGPLPDPNQSIPDPKVNLDVQSALTQLQMPQPDIQAMTDALKQKFGVK